jgi:hypothetical protein
MVSPPPAAGRGSRLDCNAAFFTQAALADLIALSGSLVEIERRTGRRGPDMEVRRGRLRALRVDSAIPESNVFNVLWRLFPADRDG